ncbi:hypothetical protein K2173_016180 [Erythroxylum novogranatense]|uniref:DUF8003 domain-containing protein n=1 Tax=Erythroxylum novogranatense TaxID=1862640 RepID=A0AAV8SFS4_9ROSI|nr:hypothetical protein K2173_016180 [Erythroxylum novogranatense]
MAKLSLALSLALVCNFMFYFLIAIGPRFSSSIDPNDDFSIFNSDEFSFHGDYTPPSPPPPAPPPHPPSLSCEEDLLGIGNLDTVCKLDTNLNFTDDVYIEGNGTLDVLPGVVLSCPVRGCSVLINMSSDFILQQRAVIVAGTVFVSAYNVTLKEGSIINVTGLAGEPPSQTSGTPSGVQGAGGGHGGRGASCVTDNTKLPDDVWGGDAYSWSDLDKPWSYGSKGGTTSKEESFGGEGGGRIGFDVVNSIEVNCNLLAHGGGAGIRGGGGSGGSIYIKARRMTGSGNISASGGNGFAGGGGGRISIDVFSRHDDTEFFVHGGRSLGCPENAGAAGTYYDAVPRSLTVSNNNMSTSTDTILLEFPKQHLWTNVYIQNRAKASVPLFWSRVQVRGQISLSSNAVLSFGLAHYASSEFELMAEELLMSDAVVKIYGALRMSVKIHLMWNSTMLIDGGGDAILETSFLEASNLFILKGSSVIHSNANLGLHGQGFLNLSGPGDIIEAQRLFLSLFFSVYAGPGSILRGPLENADYSDMTPLLYCDQNCPMELIHPPEDCNVNSSLSFTIQICRVEYINVEGLLRGSVVHLHWVRTVIVHSSGTISASGLGCTGGLGRGEVFDNGVGGGGGHGGRGGDGYYNGSHVQGGVTYGDAELPCELGSGSGNDSLAGTTAGGGVIVMGSMEHPLSSLSVYGSLRADGQSFGEDVKKTDGWIPSNLGPGGGSGGTILLFIHMVELGSSSTISTIGGHGSPEGSGGGGGGRVHFHWSNIPEGDEYQPIAIANGSIQTRGGSGKGQGHAGGNGTITGKPCPKGLYGIFCMECPLGTFKNVSGSDRMLCHNCPPHELPSRAMYVAVRGGVTERPCPYLCVSDRYHMPNCYTALEELIYTFGGPWLFSLILLGLLIVLALVLSVARMKYFAGDELPAPLPPRHGSRIDHSFPFLESLNEVLETNRTEESQSHVHRMYFMGSNTFGEPWQLPHYPPEQIVEIVFEDAFNRFVDEINGLAAYQWWEGSVYSILSVLAYPVAWSWLQQRRKKKLQQLRDFVRSEYDHACLRSCRSRALYEGIKVAATPDLMLAYIDFFLGGDEKRADLPPRLHQRFPISFVFGGDGSYMTPFCLQSDNVVTSLMSQAVPPTIWYRLVAGLNAQLRLVRCGHLKSTFVHVISWLETHGNPALSTCGVRADLAWFQPTSSGYFQFGLVIYAVEPESISQSIEGQNHSSPPERDSSLRQVCKGNQLEYLNNGDHLMPHKRTFGGILHSKSLRTLKIRRSICFPFSLLLYNTKPIGHQDLVGLLMSILLLGDVSLVLLTLLQMYSISLLTFLLVLFVLPLGIVFPFPAGISALFSHGPRRSAGLARVYALWNLTSLINVVVSFVSGFVHYKANSSRKHLNVQSWNFSIRDESEWWMLPSGLLLCKLIQARLIDCHVANQEIQDHSLYSNDPDVFWQS